MRLQTTGLVLCALVFSTFGHELLNHQKGGPSSRRTKQSISSRSNALASRQDQDGRDNLRLLINAAANTVGLLNTTIQLGVIFDVNGGYVGLFNGQNGGVIVINLETRVGIHFRDPSSERSWVARSGSFVRFFNSVSCFKGLFEYGFKYGHRFGLGDVGEDISLYLQSTIAAVSRGEYSTTRSRAFKRVLLVSSIFIDTLRGPLRGILDILGSGVTTIKISVRTLCVGFKAIGEIVSKLKGGINVLANLNLDWDFIINEPSPIPIIIYMFSKLKAQNVDLRPILADYKLCFTKFLASLGGNTTRGINGVLKVVAEFKGLIDGRTPANELIPVVIEFVKNSIDSPPNFQEFKKQSRDMLLFLQNAGLASEFPLAVEFFNGILHNRFIYKGVDGFGMIQLLFETRIAPLHKVVRLLTNVRGIVRLENSIGLLLYYLTELIVDGSAGEVLALVPGVKIDQSLNILVFIFRGARLPSLQANLYRFFLSRPVLSNIILTIESSWAPYGRVDLDALFRSPNFAPYARAIKILLTRAILVVNGQRQFDDTTVIGNEGRHNRILHGTGTRLNAANKHLAHSAKHLKNHGKERVHVKHHIKKHHGHEKHHRHDKHKQSLRHSHNKHAKGHQH